MMKVEITRLDTENTEKSGERGERQRTPVPVLILLSVFSVVQSFMLIEERIRTR